MDKTTEIVIRIQQAISLFSDNWKTRYGLFFHTEHLSRFVSFSKQGLFNGFPEYTLMSDFTFKIDTDLPEIILLKQTYTDVETKSKSVEELKKQFQQAIEGLPFSTLLMLMGQRLSATSLRDENGLPPLRETLDKACFKPYNKHMSTVVRSWEKHADRSEDRFWPERKGNAQEKEHLIYNLVNTFYNHWQWWNIYGHYKYDHVFELRIASGHGMRWTANGDLFIGFLEPFIEVTNKEDV